MSNDRHDADVAFIKALAELLRENDLTELRVKRDFGEDDSLDFVDEDAEMLARNLRHLNAEEL